MSKKEEVKRVVHPQELFAMLNIKDFDSARKALITGFDFLIYMNPGDQLVMNNATFHKLDNDLFQVESNINSENVVDSLEKRKIVRIPG